MLLVPNSVLQPFVGHIACGLYSCAGSKAAVTPQDRERMWHRFHQFVCQESILLVWRRLLDTIPIQRNVQAETIFMQNIMKSWFGVLLQKRNNIDFPAVHKDIGLDEISEKEQTVLRYVAGFAAFKLKTFYSKFPSNKSAQHILAIVNDWKITKGVMEQIFCRTRRSG